MKESASIGIIGGADGPTSILVAGKVGTGYFAAAILLGAVLIVLEIVIKRGTTMVHHQKYFKNLFYIQISALILSILSAVPGINTVTDWANGIIQLFIIVIMFQLTAMHERYRKAAIFLCVTVGFTLISMLTDIGILTFAISICSLISIYQEYSAHSAMIERVDANLAGKWQQSCSVLR